MIQYSWSVKTSGSWGNAANWGPSGLPTDVDTVTIGIPGITVTIGSTVAASAYSLTTTGSTLTLSGGTLRTIHQATFNGTFNQSAGTYTLSGTGAIFNSTMNFTGGTIDVVTGSLQINNGASLSGTFTGAGVLNIQGTAYINAGFKSTLSSITVNGGRLGFNTNFAYTRNITVNNGVINMFGHTLASNAALLFSGVMGDGTFNDTGKWTFGTTLYATTLDNGAIVNVSGSLTQTNQVSLGVLDSGAKIAVSTTGLYAINGNWNILDPSRAGAITNAGTFAKTGGGKLARIDSVFSSTGTLNAAIGELQLNGLVNSVGGAVSGGGTLGIAGGQTTFATGLKLGVAVLHQESGVLVLNTAQTYAGEWDMSGGVLNLNSRTAVLSLTGRDSFDGGVITGYGGGLKLSGTTELSNVVIGGPEKITLTGTVDQTGAITLGQSSNPEVDIAAGASWRIESDGNISGFYGLINNAGLFSDANGSGNATVQSELLNTGTLVVNSTLTLAGTNTLGGSLLGSGLLELAGNTTLVGGVTIGVGALDVSSLTVLGGNISDAGIFTESAAGVLDTGGFTLGLSGTVSLDQGMVTGGGTLSSTGQAVVGNYVVTGGAELLISGTATQDGALTLGGNAGAGALAVAAAGSYTVVDDLDIVGGGTVAVSGKLIESGTGTANIQSLVNIAAGGNLVANDQTLTLQGGGTLAGTLSGAGRINLTAGTYTLNTGFSALSAGLEVSGNGTALLAANQTYAGDFTSTAANFALNGHTLSLTGSTTLGNNDTVSGNGVLLAAGSTTLGAVSVTGTAILQIGGSATQIGQLQVGDSSASSAAELVIAKGATDTLAAFSGIQGNGTLVVNGTLADSNNAVTQITDVIVNTGTIAANLGTLQVAGVVSAGSTGIFTIGSGAVLEFSNTCTIGLATGVSFAGTGTLLIEDLKGFGATLANFGLGDTIQVSGLSGSSLTGTYGNTAHTQILVTDGSTNQLTLNFSTAQTLSAFSFSAGANNIATITHT